MAVGAIAPTPVGSRAQSYNAKFTVYVLLVSLAAASGGLLFGYDIGVTGGVTSMPAFLHAFFPGVATGSGGSSLYCRYASPTLQLFTSSLFLAGLVSSLAAAFVTRRYGRKASLLVAGGSFMVGAAMTATAGLVARARGAGLAVLVAGRLALGVGVGFGNQAAPLVLNECAPAHLRGAFNIMFQLMTTVGIAVAQLVNLGTAKADFGWRVSLALAGVPAIALTLAGLFLPDTPNSLAARGKPQEARRVLARLRGTEEVDAEFDDIQAAVKASAAMKGGWKTLFTKRCRPELTMAVMIPLFQQLTGINSVMFYAPVIMSSVGFGAKAALLNTVIIGAVNVLSTLVSVAAVDRVGRKPLYLQGGIQMAGCHVALSALLAVYVFDGAPPLPRAASAALVACICGFVSAFAWSWGPLGWLTPIEVQPLETRSLASGINVAVNLALTTLIGQFLLTMMCAMKAYVFLLFAACVLVATVFVGVLLPETKGVPTEEVAALWKAHRVWGPIVRAAEAEEAAARAGAEKAAGVATDA